MANTTIPNLPMAISLSGAEQMEIVQSGVSKRATVSQLTAFTQNGQVIFPSYTTTQKNQLVGMVGGVVYDSTVGLLSLYNSTGWQNMPAGIVSGGTF